jgi:hypothetical protein
MGHGDTARELLIEAEDTTPSPLAARSCPSGGCRVGPGSRVRVHRPGSDGPRKLARRDRVAPACPVSARCGGPSLRGPRTGVPDVGGSSLGPERHLSNGASDQSALCGSPAAARDRRPSAARPKRRAGSAARSAALILESAIRQQMRRRKCLPPRVEPPRNDAVCAGGGACRPARRGCGATADSRQGRTAPRLPGVGASDLGRLLCYREPRPCLPPTPASHHGPSPAPSR